MRLKILFKFAMLVNHVPMFVANISMLAATSEEGKEYLDRLLRIEGDRYKPCQQQKFLR